MPFMAATLGGKLGSGLLVEGFFTADVFFGAGFFAVFLAVVVFLFVVFLIAMIFSP
jgi:hypothetical protein